METKEKVYQEAAQALIRCQKTGQGFLMACDYNEDQLQIIIGGLGSTQLADIIFNIVKERPELGPLLLMMQMKDRS